MGYLYNYKELETKEDYINQLKEIIAYRELDGQDFDFGDGSISNDMSLGSEDAYYEMDIYSLECAIEYYEEDHRPVKKAKKQRSNKYARTRQHKDKLKEMVDRSWYPVWESYSPESFPKRYYRGQRSMYLKRLSNKKFRRYTGEVLKKGNTHRRVFDFWWELY